jgi:hypothetical protein
VIQTRCSSGVQNKFPTGAYGSELHLHIAGRRKADVQDWKITNVRIRLRYGRFCISSHSESSTLLRMWRYIVFFFQVCEFFSVQCCGGRQNWADHGNSHLPSSSCPNRNMRKYVTVKF